jgi:hypothetical protein
MQEKPLWLLEKGGGFGPKLCRGACHAQEPDWRNNRIDFAHLHSLPAAAPRGHRVCHNDETVTRLKRRDAVFQIIGKTPEHRHVHLFFSISSNGIRFFSR